MAYVNELRLQCDTMGCTSVAKVEVFNTFNASVGRYCRRHGRYKFDALREREEEGRLDRSGSID